MIAKDHVVEYGFFDSKINLKGSNSQFGWPSMKVDPNSITICKKSHLFQQFIKLMADFLFL